MEDWNEMEDLAERFPEYDDMNTEDLDLRLEDLNQRLLTDNDPLVTERITYINSLINEQDIGETSFTVRSDVFAQVDKYAQDSGGNKLDPYSESVIELRRRTTIKDGKVTFKVKLNSGALSSVENIVLDRDGDMFTRNSAKRNATAVSQFEELIDDAVSETRDREALPLLSTRGNTIPADVFDRLSVAGRCVVNGVLNPSDTILPETRIGDRGAIQLTIDELRERSNANLDKASKSDIVTARELFQESFDQDAIADAFEQQRVVEETRNEQEKDVTRLERVKKWIKENWVGASALGITIAGLVTTIIVGTRSVVTKGAKATLSFARAVKNVIENVGPWAAGANLAYTIIKAGAQGISFLARNLWIVVMFLTYLFLRIKKYV